MDLIICRNVLMYLTPEVAGRVVGNLYRSLVDGGWLLVSAVESSLMGSLPFVAVDFPGVIFYRKDLEKKQVQVKAESAPHWTVPAKAQMLSHAGKEVGATPPAPAVPPIPTPSPAPGEGEDHQEQEGALTPYEEALASYQRGHYAEAEKKLLELLTPDAGNVAAMALMARARANQGKLEEALGWGEKVVAADKLSPGSHYLLATILQEQGRVAEAAASWKRTLYLDQDFVLAHFTLGHLALAQRRIQESRRHFANVLSLLRAYGQDDLLPEAEGMTAGRLRDMVASMSRIA